MKQSIYSRALRAALSLGLLVGLALPMVARASGVDTAIVDVTDPTSSVTLTPGGSGPITINLTVTGKQEGTATFKVYRDWKLAGTEFTGSNPQTFTVYPRLVGASATTFSTTGTVSVEAGQVNGSSTLTVGVFDITNSNETGAKLSAGNAGTYTVTVSAPSDTTAPVITPNVSGTLGSNGWYTSNVTVTWDVTDDESSVTSKSGCDQTTLSTDTAGTTLTCSATSAGGTSSQSVTIKRDSSAPTLSGAPTTNPNAAGWYNGDVIIHWTAADALSGLAGTAPTDSTITGEGNSLTATASVSDKAGNTTSATSAPAVNIDKTKPTVSFVGGPADGGTYIFGSVPAAPTCSASDALSDLAGACIVSGYSSVVGQHTVTASATDKAGNTKTVERSYTVEAWTLRGFYQPVDMGNVLNTVKGGATVPMKFEVFAGSTELTDTAIVKSLSREISCAATGGTTDEVELTATGGTSLRYDATAGQFVYNWQTPKTSGKCYQVTLTTQDESTLSALFKTK